MWGKPGVDIHPASHVPAHLNLRPYVNLRCRRFAALLTVTASWERVEFAWFSDNRAIVTLSQSPLLPGSQFFAESEVFYFDALPAAQFPRKPVLTILLRDKPLCSNCRLNIRGVCRCASIADSISPSTTSLYLSEQHRGGNISANNRQSGLPSVRTCSRRWSRQRASRCCALFSCAG